jgi:hypothetical protein
MEVAVIMMVGVVAGGCVLLQQVLTRLSRIEKQLQQVCTKFGVDPNGLPALSDAVKQIANDPREKIPAIKLYRDETGCGLADAKDAVEAYIRSQNP